VDDQNQPSGTTDYTPHKTPELPQTNPSVPPIEVEPATQSSNPVVPVLPSPVSTHGEEPMDDQAMKSSLIRRRKVPVFALGAALLIVLFAAASALAYTWYQNPDRVIMDGFAKALQAKTVAYSGTITAKGPNDDSKSFMKLDIKGAAAGGNANVEVKATIEQDSQQFEISGKGVFAKDGTLYIQFKDLQKLLDGYLQDNPEMRLPEESKPLIDKLLAKVDGRWIKISPSDLEDYSSEVKNTMTCIQDATVSFRNDEQVRNEFMAIYQSHPFVRMEDSLGIKNGSYGYVIGTDKEKEKAFWIASKKTKFYKQLVECDDSFKIDEEDMEPEDTVKSERTEIWLSQWRHEITRVNVRSESNDGSITEMSWLPVFNEQISVDIPSDARTLTELQADMEAIFEEYMMSQIGEDPAAEALLGQTL
jgi:hypothetical protein